MEIKRARVLGFCMGVRRAMEKAFDIVETGSAAGVATLGPLIHNRLCIEDLEAKGVRTVKNADEVRRGEVVIVRAHGIPPATYRSLESRGAVVVDATCPRVIKSQKIVKEYADKNFFVVIIGDRNHGEITGLSGFARERAIVQDEDEAERFSYDVSRHAGLMTIAQTTLKREEYDAAAGRIKSRYPGAVVINSICPATRERQESLLELAGEVDALVIVGGRNSANTTRLYRTALATGLPVWYIEEASELPAEIASYGRIGISAGASTPDAEIEKVERFLHALTAP